MTFRHPQTQYLTFTGDKTVKKKKNSSCFSVMALNRCATISYHRNWMDLLLMPTEGPYGTNIDLCLISLNWPEDNPSNKSPNDWSVPTQNRHSPKQINTIQGAAEKQDELVPLNKQTPSCLFTRSKATQHLCFPQCVCQWPQPWPTGPPSLGREVILYWVCLWYWGTPMRGGIFYKESHCVCFGQPRQLHDAKAISQCSWFSQMTSLSIWHYVDKK